MQITSHKSFVELDLEYRFWSFMETHPAHTALLVKAKAEAMDIRVELGMN